MLLQIIPVVVFLLYLILYSILRCYFYEVYYKRYFFDRPEYYNNTLKWIRFLFTIYYSNYKLHNKLFNYLNYTELLYSCNT